MTHTVQCVSMYNDLKISVLNNKTGYKKEGKFVSFPINTMALKIRQSERATSVMPVNIKRNKRRSVVVIAGVHICYESLHLIKGR